MTRTVEASLGHEVAEEGVGRGRVQVVAQRLRVLWCSLCDVVRIYIVNNQQTHNNLV